MESKLTGLQLYAMMLVFLLGTSIIYGTPRLVPDSWLIDIVAIVPYLLLTGIYLALFWTGCDRNLYELLVAAWGKHFGKLFALGYSVYFLYIASRNLRDMVELILTALLRNTPSFVIVLAFICIVAYAACGGIIALGRFSILIAGMVLFFFVVLTCLLYFSDSIEFERVLPFLSEGLGAVAGASLRSSIWFPYGEVLVFLAFGSSLGGAKTLRKIGLLSLLSATVILSFSNLLQTSVLGIETMKYSVFALLDAARLINIENFITRMDALVAFIIIFGVIVKSAIFLYASAKGAEFLFGSDWRGFAPSLALLIGALSIKVSRNNAEHVSEGLVYAIYWLHIPFQLAIPLATLLLLRLR
jgi:Spore germination protein.